MGTAVALVNAVADPPQLLAEILARHNFLVGELDRQDVDRLRDWSRRLRPVFTADQQAASVRTCTTRLPAPVWSTGYAPNTAIGHACSGGTSVVVSVTSTVTFL